MTSIRNRRLGIGVSAFLLAFSGLAEAHEKKTVGALQLTIGWGDEPAFAGSRNSVDLDVSDPSGSPVTEGPNRLSVEVSFGDQHMTLPMLPAASPPGRFRAWIVPTRAGTYAFRITGRLKDQLIDITSACSEKTFHCVTDPADLQFPEKDLSAGQLTDRITQSQAREQQAIDGASDARMLSFVSLAIAAVGVAATAGLIGVGSLRSRRGRTGRKST